MTRRSGDNGSTKKKEKSVANERGVEVAWLLSIKCQQMYHTFSTPGPNNILRRETEDILYIKHTI